MKQKQLNIERKCLPEIYQKIGARKTRNPHGIINKPSLTLPEVKQKLTSDEPHNLSIKDKS